jgi:uncharacterized membrane protein
MSERNDRAAGEDSPAASLEAAALSRTDAPLYAITLWPHQSMTRPGFRWFMAALAAGLGLPLLALWGTPVGLFLAPFLIGALALVWLMIRMNQRARRMSEALRLWPDLIAVERRDPGGRVRRWAANPYWVAVDLRDTPKVEKYLTLRGGGRTIELGAFLTPEERLELADGLRAALRKAISAPGV